MTYFLSVCLSVCLSVIRFHLILFPVLPFPSEGASSTKRPGKTASKSSFIQRTASESIIPLHYSSNIWHAKNGTTTRTTRTRTTIPSTKSAEIGSTSEDTVQDSKRFPKGTSPTVSKRPYKTVSKVMTSQETTFTTENIWFESVHSPHPTISPFQSTWHTKDGTTRETSRATSSSATTIRTTKSADTGPVSKDTFQEPRSSYDSTTSLENANEKTRVNSSVVSESMLSSKMITSQNRSQSDRYSMQSFPISEEGGHSDLGILQTEEPASISQEIVDHTPAARFASDTPSLTSFLALKSDIGITRGASSMAPTSLAAKISPSPTTNTQKTSQTLNAVVHPAIKSSSLTFSLDLKSGIGITRGASSVAPSGLLAKISPSPAANTPRTSQSSRSIAHTSIKTSSSEPLVISTRITASADTKHIVSN